MGYTLQRSIERGRVGYYLARSKNYKEEENYQKLAESIYPDFVIVDYYTPPAETDIQKIDIRRLRNATDLKKLIMEISNGTFNSHFLNVRDYYCLFRNIRGIVYISDITNLGDTFEEIIYTLVDLKRYRLEIKIAAWDGKTILYNKDLFDVVMMFLLGVQMSQGLQPIGIAAPTAPEKKTAGKRGQPPIERPNNWEDVIRRKNKGEITSKEAIEELHLKRSTFYNMLKKYGN